MCFSNRQPASVGYGPGAGFSLPHKLVPSITLLIDISHLDSCPRERGFGCCFVAISSSRLRSPSLILLVTVPTARGSSEWDPTLPSSSKPCAQEPISTSVLRQTDTNLPTCRIRSTPGKLNRQPHTTDEPNQLNANSGCRGERKSTKKCVNLMSDGRIRELADLLMRSFLRRLNLGCCRRRSLPSQIALSTGLAIRSPTQSLMVARHAIRSSSWTYPTMPAISRPAPWIQSLYRWTPPDGFSPFSDVRYSRLRSALMVESNRLHSRV